MSVHKTQGPLQQLFYCTQLHQIKK
uniref:Uncharacterized protein n=1 Tax=Anguilla anguilla TaxID=7936 RepID=A0A0E9RY97_ANGAN